MTETVVAGAGVQLSGQVASGCEQDGVAASCPVGRPDVVGVLGDRADVADVDAAVVDVVGQRGGISFSQRQRGCSFGMVGSAGLRVGEPDDLSEGDGAVARGQVAQEAGGADGGQLAVVADQPH